MWHIEQEGALKLNPVVDKAFKGGRFRWFQMNMSDGKKGVVYNRQRYAELDPETPGEFNGIEVCLGQAWLLAAKNSRKIVDRHCALSLTLASACLRDLWSRSNEAHAAAAVARTAADARGPAKDGLVMALLTGVFDRSLSGCRPVENKAVAMMSQPPELQIQHWRSMLDANSRAAKKVCLES